MEQAGVFKIELIENVGIDVNYFDITDDTTIDSITGTGDTFTYTDNDNNKPKFEYENGVSFNNKLDAGYSLNFQILDLTRANENDVTTITESIYGWIPVVHYLNGRTLVYNRPFFVTDIDNIDTNDSLLYTIEMNPRVETSVKVLDLIDEDAWINLMVNKYLVFNSHYDSPTASDAETALRKYLASSYVMADASDNYFKVFGPAGLNKQAPDFILFFSFDPGTASTEETCTKTGDTLKWNLDDVIYNQNNSPARLAGSGDGYAIVTTTDGWDGLTTFKVADAYNQNPPFVSWNNLTSFNYFANQFTGTFPNIVTPQLDFFGIEFNSFTGIVGNGSNIISLQATGWFLETNTMNATTIDNILQMLDNFFMANTPIDDFEIDVSGAGMGDLNNGPFNQFKVSLENTFSNAGHTFDISFNED